VNRSHDQLDTLLSEYDRRKQDETKRMVQRALELEYARRRGAQVLRDHAIAHTRGVAEKLEQAGHRVLYQEFLDAYPPTIQMHLHPKAGPMDVDQPTSWSVEFTWGDDEPERLFIRRRTSRHPTEVRELASASEAEVDELWVREQLLTFVRDALDLT
jgi:hypothetical protein